MEIKDFNLNTSNNKDNKENSFAKISSEVRKTYLDKEAENNSNSLRNFNSKLGIDYRSTTNRNSQTSELFRLVGAVDIQNDVNYISQLTTFQSDMEKWSRGAKMLGKGVISVFLMQIDS